MKTLSNLLALVGFLAVAQPVTAQTLPLQQLQKLGSLPAGLPLEKMTAALLPPDWTFRGPVGNTAESYWTAGVARRDSATITSAAEAATVAESWLSLRPMPGGLVDVLFKTQSAGNFEPLRRELKRLKLPVVPVTCLECTGERYDGPNYTVTLYSGKKGPYKYILVLHQTPVLTEPVRPVPLTPPVDAETEPAGQERQSVISKSNP